MTTKVRTASVGANYFEVLNTPIVRGRGFTQADVDLARPVAIVDQTFVRSVLGGADPIGQRVRQTRANGTDKPGPWHEIVGVVPDLTIAPDKTSEDAVLYRPAAPGALSPVRLGVQVNGDVTTVSPRLRAIAADVDPTLRLYDLMRLDQVGDSDRLTFAFFLRAVAIVSAVALMLSAAGIYSLMAFTVARRRREIGIRMAVGADRRRIITGIFSRAFAQLGLGILVGSVPGGALLFAGIAELSGAARTRTAVASLVIAVFMLSVGLLASAVPMRRALRIQPTEVLRAD